MSCAKMGREEMRLWADAAAANRFDGATGETMVNTKQKCFRSIYGGTRGILSHKLI